jgi:hypothetical protein
MCGLSLLIFFLGLASEYILAILVQTSSKRGRVFGQ